METGDRMPRLITFDGPSASGKKTNNNKLCEHLGIVRRDDCFFSQAMQTLRMPVLSGRVRPLVWSAVVGAAYKTEWIHKGQDVFTIVAFWGWIIDYLRWNIREQSERAEMIDAVDAILSIVSEDIYPICSFYLDISHYDAAQRFINREAKQRFHVGIEDIAKPLEEDKQTMEMLNWFADRYPFFHIIDASQSEEDVFNEVLTHVQANHL